MVADAAYGNDTKFRQALLDMGLEYVVGIQPTLSVWPPGKEPLPPRPRKSMGRPPKLRQRAPRHQPVLAKDLAAALAPKDWQTVPWRDGTNKKLQSRFTAVRVRPANRDYRSWAWVTIRGEVGAGSIITPHFALPLTAF